MLFGRKKTPHHETMLLVDVRNAHVRLSVLHNKKDFVQILTTKKYDTPAGGNLLSSDAFAKQLDMALSDFVHTTLPTLVTEKHAKVREVIVVFSAPWYEAQMTHVRFKQEAPVPFTKELYDSLVAKEPTLANSKGTPLEQHITHILLNDYELTDPFGKMATSADIAFYTSHLDAATEKTARDMLAKHLPKLPVTLHSSGFINFQALRTLFANIASFMFFDIAHEMTEIGIVKNNTLDALVTIPLGRKHLLGTISAECKLNDEHLTSSLNMLASGDLDDACSIDIFEVVQKEGAQWATEIGKAVSQLGDNVVLPQKLFLFSDSDIEPFAQMLLRSETVQKNALGGSATDVMLLAKQHLVDMVKADAEAAHALDSLLLIKALFLKVVEK